MAKKLTAPTIACLMVFAATSLAARAADPAPTSTPPKPGDVLNATLARWAEVIQPPQGQPAKTFVTRVRVVKAEGLPKAVAGLTAEIAYQSPDRLLVRADVEGKGYSLARDGQQLWVHIPHKQFALLGKSGVPRFTTHPNELDTTSLPPFSLPGESAVMAALALTWGSDYTIAPKSETPQGTTLHRFAKLHGTPGAEARVTVRDADLLPVRMTYTDGKKTDVELEFENPRLLDPWAADKWRLQPAADAKVETVALAHLVRFLMVAPDVLFNNQVPTLGPPTGERKVVARSGNGRLEMIDGTRVLFLQGTPVEMGRQHGTLLKKEILGTLDRMVYGIGVGSSFDRGKWFFGEIEHAQGRVEKFTDPRYLAEMDAIAAAVGAHPQEGRLANFFPELFHCSGFALMGKATVDGRMYHGRVLDYMKGVGLEQNAVVIVHKPDAGLNAWVNVGYAGFVGSVTAMNEKGISLGEMGGRGYGHWDGKPMAQLVREVMEKADTLDEAVAIMREGPRTCEYYYVISDGNAKTAVGVAATHDTFEVVKPGQSHSRLPHGVEDAVLLSAGARYEELVRRVKANYGQFDHEAAIGLMTRPVCMTSNIQSVLFAPDTLEFWVANADSKNVASHTRYTHYNLKELLKAEGTAAVPVRP